MFKESHEYAYWDLILLIVCEYDGVDILLHFQMDEVDFLENGGNDFEQV